MMPITDRIRARPARLGALTALFLFGLGVPAPAKGPEARGPQLQQALEQGAKRCADLDNSDFEALGELAMGRSIGSPRAHAAMNRFMTAMMGRAGEERMHQLLGRRFSGCGGGAFPAGAGVGRMMGALGTMGSMMGGYGQPGGSGTDGASGSMMGGYGGGTPSNQSEDQGPSAAAMVGMMAVLVAAVALIIFLLRPRRRSQGALDLLQQRFARGDLSPGEYQRDRQLLQGGD